MIMPTVASSSSSSSQVLADLNCSKSSPSPINNNSSGSSNGVGVSLNPVSNMANSRTSTGSTTSGSGIECAGCGSFILDKYYLSAVDRHWHISCLKCSQCKVDLQAEPSCFSRDGLIFCKADYYRLFTMRRCSRCGEGIYASELVMRVRDQNVYHIQCFTCAWCNVTLSQGDLFGIRDNLVYCRVHYEMLSSTSVAFSCASNTMLSLGPQPSSEVQQHQQHSHHHSQNSSPMHDPISAETCSTMAATPYASGGIYSPLSIGGISSTPIGNSGQSPTTPQSIRKGRPRKRKNIESQNDSLMSNNSCTHGSLSPTISRNSHSPGIGGSLDGGPLTGLAASIENSCMGNSQLSNSSLSLGSHQSNRTKRMRTSFKHHQLRTMKTYFNVNQNPDAKDLKQLAQKTGLSKRVLQVWFQNARAKWRRNNLKMMPDGTEMTLNGQTLLSMGHSSTPSTVIGSPSGSTRPFSSPSPVMSPSGDTGGTGSHQSSIGPPMPSHSQTTSSSNMHSQPPPGLNMFSSGRSDQSTLIPINFQELY